MVEFFNVREFIEKGKKLTLYWNNEHYPEPIPYRPLTEGEIEKSFNYPFTFIKDEGVKTLYFLMRTNPMDDETEVDLTKVDLGEWIEVEEAVTDMIIYLAMKDFQDEKFKLENVKDMKDRDSFAEQILDDSGKTEHAEEVVHSFREKPVRAEPGILPMEEEQRAFRQLFRSNPTSD